MKMYKNIYWSIISPANLFSAWEAFKSDKRNKTDVAEFEQNLEKNIFQLYRELKAKTYKHGVYKGFWIHDPKRRRIHKATVCDRVLHHAIFNVLNPIFEPTFIPSSFSCRVGKGTHKGMKTVAWMLRAESRNDTRACWALKCDVRKFFDSVDHETLFQILAKRIADPDVLALLRGIIGSYESEPRNPAGGGHSKGIPIGNLTSQLFANVYMNELDQFVKHTLRVKYYARYTDDFLIISNERKYLADILPRVKIFLHERLRLELHPQKISIRTCHQGIDFLGYVLFPHHILVRATTKRRMLRKLDERITSYKSGQISEESLFGSLRSYLGVLSHADAHELQEKLLNDFWFRFTE